jgi:hypothetical protein
MSAKAKTTMKIFPFKRFLPLSILYAHKVFRLFTPERTVWEKKVSFRRAEAKTTGKAKGSVKKRRRPSGPFPNSRGVRGGAATAAPGGKSHHEI